MGYRMVTKRGRYIKRGQTYRKLRPERRAEVCWAVLGDDPTPKMRCPLCDRLTDLNDDQLHGRQSVTCRGRYCHYIVMVNFFRQYSER